MKLSERERVALEQLLSARLGSWNDRHKGVPSVLYHYTSADGLIGILRTMSIWLTDLRYMNDLSELQYSRDLVSNRLETRRDGPRLDPVQQEFIKRIGSTFDPFRFGHSVFSASFCEEGNLLSQWRAYRGRGGGYAIGFDFFHTLRLLNKPCVLRRVIYDVDQQRQLVDETVDAFLTTVAAETAGRSVQDVTSTFLPAACEAFSAAVGEHLFSFKHPDFREEREWRLVHFANVEPRLNRGVEIPQFRTYEGNVIPYFTVSFERAITASRDDTYGIPFPVAELIIGPTINADLNEESTKTLLLALNPDIEPGIRRSEIPLRWL